MGILCKTVFQRIFFINQKRIIVDTYIIYQMLLFVFSIQYTWYNFKNILCYFYKYLFKIYDFFSFIKVNTKF